MNIRKKTAIITIVIFISLLGMNSFMFIGAYEANVEAQQKTILALEAQKSSHELQTTMERLETISYDWGTWDDTVRFVNGNFPEYPSEYFYDDYFAKMHIDLLAFSNNKGQVVFEKIKEDQHLNRTKIHLALEELITGYGLLEKIQAQQPFSINRILLLEEGFIELNARSITDNLGQIPPQGIIFSGNLVFDGDYWTKEHYTITNVTGDPQLEGFQVENNVWYKFENYGDLQFYLPSELLEGQRILIERSYPEVASFMGKLTQNLIILFFFVAVSAVIYLVFFRKNFMDPLSHITEFMGSLNLNNIENKRLEMHGDDDFANLAEYINGALSRIEEGGKTIKELNQRYVQALEAADAGSFSLSVTDMIFRMDEKLANLIGYTEPELEFKLEKLRKYFDQDDVEKLIKDAKYYGVSILNNDIVLGLDRPGGEKRYLLFKSDLNRNRDDDDIFDITGIALEYTEEYLRERKLEFISFHDVLTGLYNRSFFENTIDKLELNAKFPYGVIIGDMNGLKMVNDTFGHEEGDRLLSAMGVIFKSSCRPVDMIFRWGGDEFAVVLPGADLGTVEKVVEKINRTLENFSGAIIPPSISLGYSVRDNTIESSSVAIRSAEEHMYGQKVSQSKEVRQNLIDYFKNRLNKNGVETAEHNHRLEEMAIKAGTLAGYSSGKIEELRDLTMLHDIGMVSVKEEIIMKPGKLDREEREQMELHTETGFRICKATPELSHISYAVLTHHEHVDGGGYPKGLKGPEIPSIARLFAVLDAYESLTHDRPYRKAVSQAEALEEIRSKSGTQFDPAFVEILLKIV